MTSCATDFNLLLVSDLHLADLGYGDRSVPFAAWLGEHRDRWMGNRPWRLLMNGDTFEFLNTRGVANADVLTQAPSATTALQKLEVMLQVEPATFEAIARFVCVGHEAHFVLGNHDRDLFFPTVQDRLREALFSLCGSGEDERESFYARICFHPWHYWEPGIVYVEHGNQFDELSCYSDVTISHPEGNPELLEEPVAHVTARHFVSNAPDGFDLDNLEHWGFGDYLKWGFQSGLLKLLGLLWLYICAAVLTVVNTIRYPMKKVRQFRQAVATDETRRRLRSLWKHRAGPWRTMCVLMLDRLLLLAFWVVLLFTITVLIGWSGTAIVGVAAGLVLSVGLWWYQEKQRDLSLRESMAQIAEQVRTIVGVPIIVFGHSHVSEIHPLHQVGTWYLNPGGWKRNSNTPGFFILERKEDGGLLPSRFQLD